MRQLFLGLLLSLMLAACSSGPKVPPDDEMPRGEQGGVRKVGNPYKVAGEWYRPKEDPNYDEVGYASWYGTEFHGKKTANGELYNMNALTAAHKTLPLPTYVKVTNLENGRSIVLRVNDRGPFVKGRIIDVSRRGAQLLGFDKQGVTKVRVQASDEHGTVRSKKRSEIVKRSDPVPEKSVVIATGDQHYIQVGAYSSRENAETQVARLRKAGHMAAAESSRQGTRTFWRVRIGPFLDRILAEEKLDRVVADGFYEARIFTESSR